MAKTIKYTRMVELVSKRSNTSYNSTLLVIRKLSDVLTHNIEIGNDIECRGLFTIEYVTSKRGKKYKNPMYKYDQQVKDIAKILYMSELEVSHILSNYYEISKELVESGNQINVKSIGYIEPKEDKEKGVYTYFKRISPSLVKKKTAKADFLLITDSGKTKIEEVPLKELTFKMVLSDSLEAPVNVNEDVEI